MSKRACAAVSVIAGIIGLIGLVSFVGKIRSVNAGTFIFPALIAAGALIACKKK